MASLLQRLFGIGGKSKPQQQDAPIRARYDAAQTTTDNYRHWAQADSLSANRSNSRSVRKTLRERSRYEVANNCYAKGMLSTISAYMIGTGPTLELLYRGPELTSDEQTRAIAKAALQVEQAWAEWCYVRGVNRKMLTACFALDQDGESFFTLTNGSTARTPVALDLREWECDHFDAVVAWDLEDSGIVFNADGEPVLYAFDPDHPGDIGTLRTSPEYLPADRVLHLYRADRPGQARGIPRLTPALPLFSQLRRFALASLTAAETAANLAAVTTSKDYGGDDEDAPATREVVEFERGLILDLPPGRDVMQLKAEHPISNFDEVIKAYLREIGRCLNLPRVIALGDASDYNYSSGRLDLQNFLRCMTVDRSTIFEARFMDRLLTAWIDEAILIEGFLPDLFRRSSSQWSWSWRWPEPEHVDRQKEAEGQATELANNTTTLAREFARRGLNWESELRQRARELALLRELNMGPQQPNNVQPQPQPQPLQEALP